MARIAGLISPPIYSAVINSGTTIWVPLISWVVLFVGTAIVALLLPRETKGKDIDDEEAYLSPKSKKGYHQHENPEQDQDEENVFNTMDEEIQTSEIEDYEQTISA